MKLGRDSYLTDFLAHARRRPSLLVSIRSSRCLLGAAAL